MLSRRIIRTARMRTFSCAHRPQHNGARFSKRASIQFRKRRPRSSTVRPLPSFPRCPKERPAFSVCNTFIRIPHYDLSRANDPIAGRVSKFRHLHGTLMPRNTHLENFRGLDNALPTECNGFHGKANFYQNFKNLIYLSKFKK